VGFEANVIRGYRINDGSIIDDVLIHLQAIRELIRMVAPGTHTHHPTRKRVSPFVLRGEKPHSLEAVATPSATLPTRYKGMVQRAIRLGTS
jgi:hypothetical protein